MLKRPTLPLPISRLCREFRDDKRGSVTILSAILLPILIGVVSLVAEFGYALLTRVTHQRVADLAAFAGGLAYASTGSTATVNAAVANIAALNGVPTGAITGLVGSSPTGSGNQAVTATVSTTQILLLAPVIRSGNQLPVSASAVAELGAPTGGCVIALSSAGTGVTLSGGTSISAAGCAVASNATVTVPCGTSITTRAVSYYSSSVPSEPCDGIRPPTGVSSVRMTRALTADPLAGNAGVTAATARLASVASLTSPSGPNVTGGGNIHFGSDQSSTQAQALAAGCTASLASSTWTLTCPGGSTVRFANLTLGGGINVNFNTDGTSSTIYEFSGSVTNSGAQLNFGPGTYRIAGGLSTGGGSTTTFGAGTFHIGRNASNCAGSDRYSICHKGGTLRFGGPSAFTLAAGIYNDGGSTLLLGEGTTNSYRIGAGSDGNAFHLLGGSVTRLGDATGVGSEFTVVGDINVVSKAGSCLTLPAAAQHDINGDFLTAGGTRLGSGVYTVNGSVGLGNNGGGDESCHGSTVGMVGTDVSFVISGVTTPTSGPCAGQAFCVAAGYGNVALTAPTTGPTANLVVIGPTDSTRTAGAAFAHGVSTSLSGTFYFPNGPVSLTGGASVGNGSGQCLQLIGSQVSLSGGTSLSSLCVAPTTSTNGSVAVVQ